MKRRVLTGLFALLAAGILAGCAASSHDAITQFSFIDAILAGAYDGQAPLAEVVSQGSLGIGTFHRLDGEMVVLEGEVHQVRYDGSVRRPSLDETTPFACVTEFSPDKAAPIQAGTHLDGLKRIVDLMAPNQNVFCAIKAHGTFSYMLTRSVPPQDKPYPPLVEVTKNQPQFEIHNVSGVLVGFRTPPYAKGIGVPGYHLHFISEDRRQGGHVLDFVFQEGALELDLKNRFVLITPGEETALQSLDFTKDRSRELKQAETHAQ